MTEAILPRNPSSPISSISEEIPSIFYRSPLLPGLTNIIYGPWEVKDTLRTLKISMEFQDSSTKKAALLRLGSGLFSSANSIISFCKYLFSFLDIPNSWGLLALSLSCNISALLLCLIEGILHGHSLFQDIRFLQDPLFLAKKFLSIPFSKTPVEDFHNYQQHFLNNRKKFEKILGKETVDHFSNLLEEYKTNISLSSSTFWEDPAFEKMKKEILLFHWTAFFQQHFAISPKYQKEVAQLQSEIDFLIRYQQNPHERESLKKSLQFSNILHSHGKQLEMLFQNNQLPLDKLILYLTQKKKWIENNSFVQQISLSKRLRPKIVMDLKKKLPLLLKNLSSQDPLLQKPALMQAEHMLLFLETQAIKNTLLHFLGGIAILITFIGFALLLPLHAPFGIAMILISVGFVVSIGSYIFGKSILDELGWGCDLEKSIPSCLRRKIFFKKKIPPHAQKV